MLTTARDRQPASDLILVSLLAGALATFALGYTYGLGNHVELLPHVERLLDPSFAVGDFSVDSSAGGPREYFARLCAWLGGLVPLPAVFLLLTLLQNAGTAFVTSLAARRLFPEAPAAPLIAVILVLAINGPALGEAGFLRLPNAVAFTVATPLALASLWLGLCGRPAWALLPAIPAALIHPLVGLEIPALGMAAAGLERLAAAARKSVPAADQRGAIRSAAASLLGLGVLIAAAYGIWLRGQPAPSLDAASFIDIYARFRAPHHLWPSAFPVAHWIAAAVFLVAAALILLVWLRRGPAEPQLARRIAVLLAFFPAAALAGWLFVEVLPLRSVAILQLFRLTSVLKWLAYLLAAGACGRFLRERLSKLSLPGLLLGALGLIAVLAAAWNRPAEADLDLRRQCMTLAWLALTAAAWLLARRPAARWLAAVGAAAFLIAILFLPAAGKIPVLGRLLAATKPVLTLEAGGQREDGAARFCRERLPPGSLLLVPPLAGRVRIVSRQPLLTDFKFMPTTDAALVEWKRRLEEAYGPWTGKGFAAARSMDRNYRRIAGDRLSRLRALYGVDYAVLYADTPCSASEMFRDRFFKVVRIPDAP